jgi:GntR family transcriptional regulator
MNVILSTASDKPIYQQMFEQISSQIVKGELAANSVLPPIRTVAKELRISVITVKKAWEELERRGFIYSMMGRGCFVAPLKRNDLDEKRDALAREKLDAAIAYYRSLGLTRQELIDLINELYGD